MHADAMQSGAPKFSIGLRYGFVWFDVLFCRRKQSALIVGFVMDIIEQPSTQVQNQTNLTDTLGN